MNIRCKLLKNKLCDYLTDEKNSSDLIVKVNREKFNVHQAFFVERSEYFKVFVDDPFNEVEHVEKRIPILLLKDIEIEEFIEILFFVYTDTFTSEDLNYNILYNLMSLADIYLMTNLKRKCANLIVNFIENENCIELLKIAKVFQLTKLEFACIKYIANNLPTVSLIVCVNFNLL